MTPKHQILAYPWWNQINLRILGRPTQHTVKPFLNPIITSLKSARRAKGIFLNACENSSWKESIYLEIIFLITSKNVAWRASCMQGPWIEVCFTKYAIAFLSPSKRSFEELPSSAGALRKGHGQLWVCEYVAVCVFWFPPALKELFKNGPL